MKRWLISHSTQRLTVRASYETITAAWLAIPEAGDFLLRLVYSIPRCLEAIR